MNSVESTEFRRHGLRPNLTIYGHDIQASKPKLMISRERADCQSETRRPT
jgi:hypothetical protein